MMRVRVTEQDFATLYREYGYLVFRRCIVYLGDAAAARDAVREVFLRAVRNPTSLRAFADSRTWLCRVADNLCLDILRRRTRRPDPPAASDETELEAAVGNDDRESLLTVRRLLDNLEPEALRLAVLFYVDELTEEELARELGWSRRAVSRRVTELLDHARALSGERTAS